MTEFLVGLILGAVACWFIRDKFNITIQKK